MKPWRTILWGCVVATWGVAASPTQAGWDNVFQVCCFHCGHRAAAPAPAPAATSFFADPCCNPCPPPPVCTTRYVQRCFYQPVTCMQTKTFYEPVTSYRTSFYWEPVTTVRHSCFFDPCTCQWHQVACPQTCYKLRSQCCPVQSWVQRCCQVPVTSYKAFSVWEPVTTCCQPAAPVCPPACPPACPPGDSHAAAPQTIQPYAPYSPGVSEQRIAPQPGVSEFRDGGANGSGSPLYNRYYPPNGTSLQRNPATQTPAAPLPDAPKVKLQNIVAIPSSPLVGQIVRNEKKPQDW